MAEDSTVRGDVNVDPHPDPTPLAGISRDEVKADIDQIVKVVAGLELFLPKKVKDTLDKVLPVVTALSNQDWFLDFLVAAVNKIHPTAAGPEAYKEAIAQVLFDHGEKKLAAYAGPEDADSEGGEEK